MIKTKINLLKPTEPKRPKGGPGGPRRPIFRRPSFKPTMVTVIFALILLGFEILFIATFYKNLSQRDIITEKTLAQANDEISILNRQRSKLKTDRQGIVPIERPESLTDKLKQDHEKLLTILEVFSKRLPSRAWINYLGQKDNHFIVQGFALNHEIISDFLVQLQKSPHFDEVKLLKAEQLEDKERKLKKFKIMCMIHKT